MTHPINIRLSNAADRDRIAELAELDGHSAPSGPALLAEVDGRLLAAVGVADGNAVSDPFERTGDIVGLLQLRAEQERERAYGRGPLLGRLMRVRQGAGGIA